MYSSKKEHLTPAQRAAQDERAEEDKQRAEEGKRAKNWETKTAAKQKEKRVKEYIENKLKPGTASLFSSMEPSTVTLEEALQLLSLHLLCPFPTFHLTQPSMSPL